jgi:plasmid stabilization system protein ParE
MKLKMLKVAQQEAEKIWDDLDKRQPKLARRFLRELRRTIIKMASKDLRPVCGKGAQIERLIWAQEPHRWTILDFRAVLVFQQVGDEIVILAVRHLFHLPRSALK